MVSVGSLGLQAEDTSDCHLAVLWKGLRHLPLPEEEALAILQADALIQFNQHHNQLTPEMFVSLAKDLQAWAPAVVVAGLADPEHIGNYLQWLSECSSQVSVESFREVAWQKTSSRGGHWHEDFGEHGSYKPLFLIQCIFFAFATRGSSHALGPQPLKTVLLRAVRTLPASTQGYLEHLLSKAHYPSPSVLSQARLYVDVSWMLYMQDQHGQLLASDCVLFGSSDSSPQGGRNWCIHEYMCIPGSKLLAVGDAALSMQQAANVPAGVQEDTEELMRECNTDGSGWHDQALVPTSRFWARSQITKSQFARHSSWNAPGK
jgi:hypothetical protein